jgi:phosphopentomutase
LEHYHFGLGNSYEHDQFKDVVRAAEMTEEHVAPQQDCINVPHMMSIVLSGSIVAV